MLDSNATALQSSVCETIFTFLKKTNRHLLPFSYRITDTFLDLQVSEGSSKHWAVDDDIDPSDVTNDLKNIFF